MANKPKKISIKTILVERELCASLQEAQSWIMAGKVIVDNQRIDKAGHLVSRDADIRVKGLSKYVGKGGFKLEGALADFRIPVSGKIVLDAGAATGGFTDCLLQQAAEKVYAVDVGFGALTGRLRNDNRVVNLEKTNISDLNLTQLIPLPSLATVDLSYLSLHKAIPIVADLITEDGDILCLIKPLFEVPDPTARRTGIIKDPFAYTNILQTLLHHVDSIGLKTKGLTHSHVLGGRGTREFFIWVTKDTHTIPSGFDINAVVQAALRV